MIKKLMATALSLGLLAPTTAFASYVCSASYYPSPSRVRAILTTGPDCTGTTTTLWFCEESSTSSSCAAYSFARYQTEELTNLHAQLARAADSQQYVYYGTTTCVGGASGCAYYMVFST